MDVTRLSLQSCSLHHCGPSNITAAKGLPYAISHSRAIASSLMGCTFNRSATTGSPKPRWWSLKALGRQCVPW